MALEIFILSVLRVGPVHGYELKRRVERPSNLTPLSNNSLYPTLKRFEQSGFVTATIEEQTGKPARKVYAITQAGRALLEDLISTLPAALATNEEEFLVRLSFFNEIPIPRRIAILSARSAALAHSAAQLRELISESDDSRKREWRNVAMNQLLGRIESEQHWITTLAERATR